MRNRDAAKMYGIRNTSCTSSRIIVSTYIIILVAIAGFWLVSYALPFAIDIEQYQREGAEWCFRRTKINSASGRCILTSNPVFTSASQPSSHPSLNPSHFPRLRFAFLSAPPPTFSDYTTSFHFGGFQYLPLTQLSRSFWLTGLVIPYYGMAVVWLLPWAVASYMRRTRRRTRRDQFLRCPSCDYDVRACPDRCSECGRTL
jgi:hypothetical protein